MPLYDFECRACDAHFEARVGVSETPPCPACGERDVQRVISSFSGPFKIGLRGYAARQSNAQRRAREEQRRERREQRRQQQ